MSLADRLALVLSIVMVLASAWVAKNIFENIPHIEDEIAYVWQAQVIAQGDLVIPSPPCPKCFLVPFVIDHEGLRTAKYPPGWPAVLGLGLKLGIRDWVNPLLSGFSLWLLYQLAKKMVNESVGLIAAILMLTSPFVLLNSGSLLTHIWSFWLSLVFIHAWLDLFSTQGDTKLPAWMKITATGFSLGLLALTRPLTVIGIGLPFVIHGVYLLWRGSKRQKLNAVWVASIAAFISSWVLIWQFAVSGDALLNPYQLWWPYDRLGFGPEVGLQPGGYSLIYARMNARFSLSIGLTDLLGWFKVSWIFIPAGMIYLRKNWQTWLVVSIFPVLVMVYSLYWIGSWLYGPRYYFEGIIGLIILSAAGIYWLAGTFVSTRNPVQNWRWISITAVVFFLVSSNVFFYLPQRLGNMRGLYGASRSQLDPFMVASAQKLTPALVIVHKQAHWIEYGTLLELSSPYLNSPWLVTYSRGEEMDGNLKESFPTRSIWHYYPDQPYLFYTSERP